MIDQNDFENSQFRRRAADFAPPPPAGPSNQQILDELRELKALIMGMQDAFPRDDLGKPDYAGHRGDHVHRINAAKTVENFKFAATMKAIGWVGGVIGLVFMTGLGEHAKRLLGG